MTTRQPYTDEDKRNALAVFALVGTVSGTAEQVGISRKTITRWIAEADRDEVQDIQEAVAEAALPRWERVLDLYLTRLEKETNRLSVAQLPVAAAVATDKVRQLRAETRHAGLIPTETPDQIAAEIAGILEHALTLKKEQDAAAEGGAPDDDETENDE